MKKGYLGFCLLALLILAGVPWLGAESLSALDIFDPQTLSHRIFWELRVPRLLVTLGLGGVLATIGATYQGVFRNPLCDPYILGVSSAVLLGVIVAETFFRQRVGTPMNFFFGIGFALALIIILMAFSSSLLASSERVILFGMGANFILSSLLFLLLSFQTQSVGGGTLKWFFGFLPWVKTNESILFLGGGLTVLSILAVFSRPIDALRLGDSVARTLGISPAGTRNIYLLFTSLVVAITVSFSGTIGFVGLVVPQLCRLLFKPSSIRVLLFQSFAIGALFLALADGISRSLLPPFEFPVGVITTILGGPIFLLTLWKRS